MENSKLAKKAGIGHRIVLVSIGHRIVLVSLALALLINALLFTGGVIATTFYLSLMSRTADAFPVILSQLSVFVGGTALLVTLRFARSVTANVEDGKLCSAGEVVRTVACIVLIVCQLAILVWAVLSAL